MRGINDETSIGQISLTYLAVQLAALGPDSAVLEPPELVDELKVLADRLTRVVGAHCADLRR